MWCVQAEANGVPPALAASAEASDVPPPATGVPPPAANDGGGVRLTRSSSLDGYVSEGGDRYGREVVS